MARPGMPAENQKADLRPVTAERWSRLAGTGPPVCANPQLLRSQSANCRSVSRQVVGPGRESGNNCFGL
jgi:hypothetical protein